MKDTNFLCHPYHLLQLGECGQYERFDMRTEQHLGNSYNDSCRVASPFPEYQMECEAYSPSSYQFPLMRFSQSFRFLEHSIGVFFH